MGNKMEKREDRNVVENIQTAEEFGLLRGRLGLMYLPTCSNISCSNCYADGPMYLALHLGQLKIFTTSEHRSEGSSIRL